MLTGMTERDWSIVLKVFDAAQSRRGEPGHDDRKFLEALHYFTVHSITWRALPREYGKWNSVWKRFWRLSRSGVFEAFFQVLAECSQTAHLVQFFDSTTARAHVSAAGAKGGSIASRSAAHAAVSRPKSISRPISTPRAQRADNRQTQAVQTRRHAMREDRYKLLSHRQFRMRADAS
jgi:transposase